MVRDIGHMDLIKDARPKFYKRLKSSVKRIKTRVPDKFQALALESLKQDAT